jgi:acetyltransferase-like isoleucine patch superfamily enzyme
MAYHVSFLKSLRDLYLRKVKWRRFNLGKNFHAGRNVKMWARDKIEIGKCCYIGRNSQIECDAELGNYVMFGNNVALVGRYDHHYQQVGVPTILADRIRDSHYNWHGLGSKVVIEDDVWVGYGSILLSGVKVGQGSIIAAGSVVTKDVDPFSIYGGVPAKKLRNRFDSDADKLKHIEKYNKLLSSDTHD